jgi:hypothetical protein
MTVSQGPKIEGRGPPKRVLYGARTKKQAACRRKEDWRKENGEPQMQQVSRKAAKPPTGRAFAPLREKLPA